MIILGISAFYHDSAAALIKDGEIVAASQEERFTRIKHDPSFPENSINYVIKEGKINFTEIDNIIFYDKPLLKFERILETYLSSIPFGFNSFRLAMPIWLREKLFLKDFLIKKFKSYDKNFTDKKLNFSEHHFSHAASAFYPSPFKNAIILTVDGVGEWATTSVAIGEGNKIKIIKEINFPHSLGLLYSAFTYYTGFKVNSGEYKLMGLAPYGKAKYKDLILENIIDIKRDGSYRLNQKYFNYISGLTMVNKKFEKLFGYPVRKSEKTPIEEFHMDIAASIQAVVEIVMINMVKSLKKEYKHIDNLCLAGGVALNCVANGKIIKNNIFKNIWIQPASGDAGGALGAALALYYQELDNERKINLYDQMKGAYIGPCYSDMEIEEFLTSINAKFQKLSSKKMIQYTAKALSANKAVGWFQGRMEFGPRALGARSILGNPKSENTQKNLNLKVKFRESFRPFAPAILFEKTQNWFDLKIASPYMLVVADIKHNLRIEMTKEEISLFGIDKLNIKRSLVPAITHVDYSARIQTVHKETNLLFYELLSEFEKLTSCPILVNTSFNVRGEPIVCTPEDAFRCFMGTNLDVLTIGNFVLEKEKQPKKLLFDYKDSFELD